MLEQHAHVQPTQDVVDHPAANEAAALGSRLLSETDQFVRHNPIKCTIGALLLVGLVAKGPALLALGETCEDTIPEFNKLGRLPKGRYTVAWPQFEARFLTTPRRQELTPGLLSALHELKFAGVEQVEFGGSLMSTKPDPGDFDMVWLTKRIKLGNLPDEMLFAPKAKYGGHIFAPERQFGDRFSNKALTARDLVSMDRDGSRFGTVILDLTKPLPPPPLRS
jgi:hypothetical protein